MAELPAASVCVQMTADLISTSLRLPYIHKSMEFYAAFIFSKVTAKYTLCQLPVVMDAAAT